MYEFTTPKQEIDAIRDALKTVPMELGRKVGLVQRIQEITETEDRVAEKSTSTLYNSHASNANNRTTVAVAQNGTVVGKPVETLRVEQIPAAPQFEIYPIAPTRAAPVFEIPEAIRQAHAAREEERRKAEDALRRYDEEAQLLYSSLVPGTEIMCKGNLESLIMGRFDDVSRDTSFFSLRDTFSANDPYTSMIRPYSKIERSAEIIPKKILDELIILNYKNYQNNIQYSAASAA